MKSFRLIDVGFGHGDMLRRIARWARRKRLAADLIGVDLNPKSAAIARAATPIDLPIEFRTGDYGEVAGPVDFVISSLVAHHMGDEDLRAFVRFMERRATKGWIVNDLYRSRIAYHGFPILARLLLAHRIVREDGQVSIGRAFRLDDWSFILRDSGLRVGEAKIVRRFPFRLCVERLH